MSINVFQKTKSCSRLTFLAAVLLVAVNEALYRKAFFQSAAIAAGPRKKGGCYRKYSTAFSQSGAWEHPS